MGTHGLAHTPGIPSAQAGPGSAQHVLCMAKQLKDLKERAQTGPQLLPRFPRTPGRAVSRGRKTAPTCTSPCATCGSGQGENRVAKTAELHSFPVQEPRTLRSRCPGRAGSFWGLQASRSVCVFADHPWRSSAVHTAPPSLPPGRAACSGSLLYFSGHRAPE